MSKIDVQRALKGSNRAQVSPRCGFQLSITISFFTSPCCQKNIKCYKHMLPKFTRPCQINLKPQPSFAISLVLDHHGYTSSNITQSCRFVKCPRDDAVAVCRLSQVALLLLLTLAAVSAELGRPCLRHRDCSDTHNSRCWRRRCVCEPFHVQLNGTTCLPRKRCYVAEPLRYPPANYCAR